MALSDFKKIFGRQKKDKALAVAKTDSVRVATKSKKSVKVDKTHVAKKPTIVIYKTLKKVLVSEKTTDLNERGQYVFLVARLANKHQVKQAIQDLYGVKVEKVRTIHLPAKPRVMRGKHGFRGGLEKGIKKAIVSLAQGEKIEVLPR